MADGGHLGNEPAKVPSRFLRSVRFFFVLIDTSRILNQKVSSMFQFFTGSRILRASSMRLLINISEWNDRNTTMVNKATGMFVTLIMIGYSNNKIWVIAFTKKPYFSTEFQLHFSFWNFEYRWLKRS